MMVNDKGLTLLEVMISMLVLTIGLLGVVPMVVLAIQSNTNSEDIQIVSNIARNSVEYYRGLDSLPTLPFHEFVNENGYGKTITINDSATDSLIPAEVVKLDVVINWQDEVGLERTASYGTYLSKN